MTFKNIDYRISEVYTKIQFDKCQQEKDFS